LVAVRRAPVEAVAFILKEGFFRFVCHPFGKLDTKRVGLMGFHDIVVLDGAGMSVPVYLSVSKPLAVSDNERHGISSLISSTAAS